MELKSIMPDDEKSKNGITVEYGDGEDKIRIKLAMSGNTNYTKAFQKRLREAFRKNPALRKDDDFTNRVALETTAKAVILDIEGLTSEGHPVKYTPELGLKLLESNPEFRVFINAQSSDMENFTEEAAEDTAELKSGSAVAS